MITIARMLPSKFVSLLFVDKSFDRAWFLNTWSTEPKKGLLAKVGVLMRAAAELAFIASAVILVTRGSYVSCVRCSKGPGLQQRERAHPRSWWRGVPAQSAHLVSDSEPSDHLCPCCYRSVSELWKHPRQDSLHTLRTQSFFFLLELPLLIYCLSKQL